MDFHFTKSQNNGSTTLLTLTGRLTAASSTQWRERIQELSQTGLSHILINLEPVTFLDSSGLAARERGGWVRLAKVAPQILEIFKLTRLDRVFGMDPDIESALQS